MKCRIRRERGGQEVRGCQNRNNEKFQTRNKKASSTTIWDPNDVIIFSVGPGCEFIYPLQISYLYPYESYNRRCERNQAKGTMTSLLPPNYNIAKEKMIALQDQTLTR